jgi:hypothetical protein
MATTTNNGWTTPDDTDLVKDGALAMRTLGQAIDTSVGVGLLPWVAYTPVLSGTGWAIGNGTRSGYYCQLGKIVHFQIRIVFGSTSTFGAAARPELTLPVTADSVSANIDFVTNVAYLDSSASVRYLGGCDFTSTTVDLFSWGSAGAYVNSAATLSTVPFTWATNDVIYVAGTYEAA